MKKKYFVVDNKGNLSIMFFYNDNDALYYFRNHWKDYIVSCLSSDYISVANFEKEYIFSINPVNGGINFTNKYMGL